MKKSKKRIGIVALSDGKGGGVTEYIRSVLDCFNIDSEHEITVLVNDTKVFDLQDSGLKIIEVPKLESNFLRKFFRLISLVFPSVPTLFLLSSKEIELFKNIDVFFCPYISPYPHLFLKKDFIFTLHDLQEFYLPKFFSFKEHCIRRVVNFGLTRKAKYIICESNFVSRDIIKFFNVPSKKIKIIQAPPSNNYLNFKTNLNIERKIFKKHNLPDKYFFYPAQYWKHKNHISLLNAFSEISKLNCDIFLVFSGAKKNGYDKIISQIDKLNLNDKVIFLGYLENYEMPYVYKNSLCLIMPSLFESISIPVFEAFSLGVPVLSSNVYGLKEQVDGAGILFDPHNSEEIYNSMLKVLNDDPCIEKNLQLGFIKIRNTNKEKLKSNLNLIFNKL